ncbi:conserved hypothetical protein [Histoplasma capsulatum G186AR]|uniref:Myb-like domain-containing protein n=1 Tax=Ajellomyces capsulatus (strain G186AR / H82 / ATCC MYA-2454 / RMSCC 2432) TaxID=447093 RepID=C0NBT8_AJECG|nr:uncharacterized protein HCBG_00584 [Histoplasma capsulatum G186AR]EEH11129.1 conserved hypothetical protein [Histoplasma capsulatum G186AR]
MPKQTIPRGSRRSRPYPDPKSRAAMMSTAMMHQTRTPAAAAGAITRHSPAWEDRSSPRTMPPPRISTLDRRTIPERPERAVPASPATPSTPSQSGPWSPQDDEILISARAQGLGWNRIQEQSFPFKSSNACRKRHERLAAKRRGSEWVDERVQRVTRHYNQLRPEIWRPLAEATGEHWEDVEKLCLERGQRNLLPMTAPSSLRRASSDNESRGSHDSHDEEKLKIPNLIR